MNTASTVHADAPAFADYTAWDFDALRERLLLLVRSVFPEWPEDDLTNFGNVLLEMFAFVGDVLGFYQGAVARESRLATATQRKNVIELAKMLGYRMHGRAPAQALLRFRLDAPPAVDVPIPARTPVRTKEVTDPVRYETLEAVTIPAGADPPEVTAPAEHATRRTYLRQAAGAPRFGFALPRRPYVDRSARVLTAAGPWTEVDTFLRSRATDRHFQVVVDEADVATLRFGDGVLGAAPSGTVSVTYDTGGGAQGRVEAGRLVVLEASLRDVNGQAVRATVTNEAPSRGGADRESIASAQALAPAGLRAPRTTVAREDFEIHALEVPGVAQALCLTADQDPSIDENSGIVFIVPNGGGAPTPALRAQVMRQFTVVYPHTLTFRPRVLGAVYRGVDMVARVHVAGPSPGTVGFTDDVARHRAQVRLAIQQRVQALFEVPLPGARRTEGSVAAFGYHLRTAPGASRGEIPWSGVFNVVRDTPGVVKMHHDGLLLNGAPTDVRLALREYPRLRALQIVDANLGQPL